MTVSADIEEIARLLPYNGPFLRLRPGPSRLTARQVRSNQRARLCQAMAEALRRTGSLRAVTVSQVAALASVSRRAFYENFGDKTDCALWAAHLADARRF